MLAHERKILEFNREKLEQFDSVNYPLRKNFNIYLFTYRRLYLDGNLFQITSNKEWINKSLTKGLFISKEIEPKVSQTIESKSKNFLWSGNQGDPLYQALFEFNIWNGITFYEFKEDFIEIFAFATEKENLQAANFYLNNMDLLKHFRTFFKDQLKHIFFTEDIKSLSINVGNHFQLPHPDEQFIKKNMNFLESTQPSRYALTTSTREISLTTREAEVLFQITQGKRAKEIANSLPCLCATKNGCTNISSRTVEAYWERIKDKFSHLPRDKIIEIFVKSDLYNMMQYRFKVYGINEAYK